ncbi:MAG: bifunctional phosphoglucose/phosphomannose isomerase [Anaerolineaceae bacterium]|nr:bifunctional phosphoglucose/phosphomannose isomerase [Anaerolineaceae bacterium]
MVELNNFDEYNQLDSLDMYGNIENLPSQLEAAFKLSQKFPLPKFEKIEQVIICGMGGSAIGGDLLLSYISPLCDVPVVVNREYLLPAWAKGESTLMIASSHSGNTEETLAAFEQALGRGCQMMAVSTGGKIEAKSLENKVPIWKFDHSGQPRTAVGFSFGLLLGFFSRLNLIPDQNEPLAAAICSMRKLQEGITKEIPISRNAAKQYAEEMHGKWVTIIGSDYLAPVSRRWKGQVSENAKAWAQYEFLPEADHNTLAGLEKPEALFENMVTIFLTAPSDYERNKIRSKFTEEGFASSGMSTRVFQALGKCALEHIWTTLLFGDYVSYYLSMLNEVDPTPVTALANLKNALS